jgi:transposase
MVDTRLFPVTPVFFKEEILPVIEGQYIWKGRPPKISHFTVFCAILYVLRTGIPWRDLPPCYGNWHAVYLRFKRGSERGLWWSILARLQQRKKLTMTIVLADSTTFKVHRHGGGQKGGSFHGERIVRGSPQSCT